MKKLKLLVSAALLGFLAWRTDWVQVADAFHRLRPGLWLAAVALYGGTQIVSAWRWQLLARPLGFERPLRHYAGFYFIGMFFNMVLPTSVGGDVVRAWYLDDRSGRRTDAFLSVLVDRGSGLLVLLALACGAALFCPIELPRWIYWSVGGTAGAAGLGVATIFLLNGGARHRQGAKQSFAAVRSQAELGNEGSFAAVRSQAELGNEGLGTLGSSIVQLQGTYLRRPALLLGTTVLSVLIQAANVVIVWLIGLAIAAPVPGVYYWIVVPMVTLLTLLPISLNGMGLREAGLILFLQPLAVPDGVGLSLAFLWFLVFTTVSLLGGCVYLFGRFSRCEVQSDGPVRGDPGQGRAGQYRAAA